MKKLLSILCLSIVVLTAASCKKETIVAPGNRTILTSVSAASWVSTDNGFTYYSDIDMPEIDSYFNDYGAVLVYVSFTDGVWEQVPENFDGTSYSFTHNTGNLRLYAQAYDAGAPIERPSAAQVKIVLVDSN
jgi:hypothetical protein